MAQELTLPASFGKLPQAFQGQTLSNDELGNGVSASYAVMGYRGKVWAVKFGGEEKPLMREDGDGPRGSIEVVIVKASPALSKIYYKNGYVEGSNAAPDCWSGDGIKPDASVQNKPSLACASCPFNAWGSKSSTDGRNGKACADSRRVAIVPVNDIDNELMGGPMLLRVPAASLKDLKAYGELLTSYNFHYSAAATRISFDPAEAFPKFQFQAIRPLTEEEAAKVVVLRSDSRLGAVLAEKIDASMAQSAAEAAKPVPSSPFENGAGAKVTPAGNEAKAEAPKTTKAKAAPAATSADDEIAALKKKLAEAEAAKAPKPKVKTPEEIAAEEIAALKKKLAEAEAAAAPAQANGSASLNDLINSGGTEDEEDAQAEVQATDDTTAKFDEMLDNILG